MINLVIYHGGCKDGFCAAWVARNALKGQKNEFHATVYSQPPPDCTEKNVFIVDFCYPREVLDRIKPLSKEEIVAGASGEGRAAQLCVLDHHKTSEAALKDYPENENMKIIFDMNRSGAGLAWDFFFPGKSRPYLVDYVEDRDLWLHRKPESHTVNGYIASLAYDFDAWDRASYFGRGHAEISGRVVLDYIKQAQDLQMKNDMVIATEWLGHIEVPIINASYTSISELLDRIMIERNCPLAVGWRMRNDGKISFSLRSRGDLDVSEIAKRFGGGGHKHAAGFERTIVDLMFLANGAIEPLPDKGKDVTIVAPVMQGSGIVEVPGSKEA
jgi:uncharacterized protein